MKLLAIDTATDQCSAALWLDGDVRTREALAPRAHGELILPMIEALLGEAALSLGALDAIAFGRGPGAFTGLRLAAAIAQGLGLAVQVPLIPVSDLRALAAQALAAQAQARAPGQARAGLATPGQAAPMVPSPAPGPVPPMAPSRALICQDARMGEVYWACFEATVVAGTVGAGAGAAAGAAAGTVATLAVVGSEAVAAPQAVVLPQDWTRTGGQPDTGGIVAAGSGFAAYPALRSRFAADVSALLPDLYPHAREIAALAAQDGLACAVAPEAALPVYLRDRVTAAP